jgi:outer membrane protein assembly factor BamB
MKLLNPLRAFLLATLLIALSGSPAVLAQQTTADVPTFQGGFTRTGEMPGPGPVPEEPIHEQWRFYIGENEASAAIVNGIAYVGNAEGHLYAIETSSGELRWQFQAAGAIRSTPTVVDGVVYVGAGSVFHAIDAATGAENWFTEVREPIIASSAVVTQGLVFFGAVEFRLAEVTTSHLYGLDISNGAIWQHYELGFDTGFGSNFSPMSSPAVSGTDVVLGSVEGPLIAVDVQNARIRWRAETWADTFAVGTGPEGTVGGPVWNRASSPIVVNDFIIYKAGDTIYFVESATSGIFKVLDLKQTALAQQPDSGAPQLITDGGATPAFSGGILFVPTFGGLLGVALVDGVQSWLFQQQSAWDYLSTPAVAQGVVYAGTRNGILYAIDAITGKEQWSVDLGGKILSSPAISGGAVYATTTSGYLIALANGPSTDSPETSGEPAGPNTAPEPAPGDTPPFGNQEICVIPTPNSDLPPGAASPSDICLTPTAGPSSAPNSPETPPLDSNDICVTPTPNNDPAPGESQPPMPCPTSPAGAPSGTSSPGDLPPLGPDDICMTPAPNGDLPPGESAPPMPCPTQMTG